MEKLNLRSPWPEVRERLKENDMNLTDQDLEYRPGEEDQLLERLSGKLNKSKKEVREYIESISSNEDKAG
ncbi:MAG: general stress protein CsbD [Chitinophagaceae bacterium]|nr:general stress protein CsbD [Chitinophagaceae bacterium]